MTKSRVGQSMSYPEVQLHAGIEIVKALADAGLVGAHIRGSSWWLRTEKDLVLHERLDYEPSDFSLVGVEGEPSEMFPEIWECIYHLL